MSEYQYYEFQTVNRPLSSQQRDELRQYSSRAQITPSSFVNTYNYGNFRGNPNKLIETYFDAFLYLANWGSRWLMLRLPKKLLSPETAGAFTVGDRFSCLHRDDHVVLSFRSEDEGNDAWVEGEGWLSALLPLRSALMYGDHRALYLGWLLAVQSEELDEDALEPMVPPGLSELDTPLEDLAQFLRIDTDLIAAAAEHSATKPDTSLSKNDIEVWISTLSSKRKDALLAVLVADEERHLIIELQQQVRDALHETTSTPDAQRRTAAELRGRARVLGDERRAKEAEEQAREKARLKRAAAKKRKEHLKSLRGKERKLWLEVRKLIQTRQPKRYDDAVALLRDLHDLAELQGDIGPFRTRMFGLHDEHQRKTSLVKRFREAKLLGGST
ncbi:MAG: hypothetical protein KAI47_08565 [Deltaproteobacteria bacterium]|nr:hypothetical protein [Deltaproteobacteria bacterium]